jgi:predicted amidohydrolase
MRSEMGDVATNLERIEGWLVKAHEQGAQFVVFPEECITGSLNKSSMDRDRAARIAEQATKAAIPQLKSWCSKMQCTVVVGLVRYLDGRFHNSALIVGPEGHLATYDKMWLPNANEQEFFVTGDCLPVVSSQGWKFSVGICADLNRGEFVHAAARHGAELFLMPIAGSGGAEKVTPDGDQTEQAKYHRSLHLPIMQAHAKRSGIYLFYANQAGRSGNNWFPGLTLAVGPRGRLLDEHLPTEGMTVTEVSKELLANVRATEGPDSDAIPAEAKNSAGEPVRIHAVSAATSR